MKTSKLTLLTLMTLALNAMQGQLTLTLPPISEYYITAESMNAARIFSPNGGEEINLIAELYSIDEQKVVFTTSSSTILLKKGMNDISSLRPILKPNYGSGRISDFVRTHHQLMSGQFRYCLTVQIGGGLENEVSDCLELESTLEMMLSLVSPFDKDTIETTLPVLNWTHSGTFNELGNDQYFRLTLCEVLPTQNSEEAIRTNKSLYVFDRLTKHSVIYPSSAEKLLPGKEYAWVVQVINRDGVVQTTDFWSFFIANGNPKPEIRYVKLRREKNTITYPVVAEKVYFSIDDIYPTTQLIVEIQDKYGKKFSPKLDTESHDRDPSKPLTAGYNQYTLDLHEFNLQPGYYTMTVRNAKNDEFKLTLFFE